MTDRLNVYGVSEIAAALGMKPNTIYQQYRRGKLPQPDAELAMGPVWTGRRIERWIEERRAGQEARGETDTTTGRNA